jgi:hypothetical protein
MKKSLFACLFLVVLYSCKKDREEYQGDSSKDFFPLTIGKQVVYDVDSIIWDDFDCTKDTNHYQMRWTIADTFRDNQSRLSYVINTDIRTQDSLPWNVHHVIAVTPTAASLEYLEDNLRFIKLIFPVENNRTWKGNSLISLTDENQIFSDWMYTYENLNEPFDNDMEVFDSTITIQAVDETINDPESLPDAYGSKTFSKEVYGKGVGLVYREYIQWVYDPTSGSACRHGSAVTMRAIEHN